MATEKLKGEALKGNASKGNKDTLLSDGGALKCDEETLRAMALTSTANR